jgi:PAS domain S-box-containing protein
MLEATARFLSSGDGERFEVVGTHVDVTERNRAQEEQTATSEILRIISNSPSKVQLVLDAVAENAARLCDANNARIWRLEDNVLRIVAAWDSRSQKVLYCSEEMFRVFGLDRQSLPTRKRFRQRVHPDDRAMVDARFERSLREKVDSFDEYRIVLPDGTLKYTNSSGHPVLDDDGNLMAFVGTAVDVTERKRAQEELERLRQLESDLAHMSRVSIMGELAASLAHEITQPIASARNNARAAINFLDKQPPELSEVREALACVVDDADRAGDIIDRLRNQVSAIALAKDHL